MGYTHPTLVQVPFLWGDVNGVGAVNSARFSWKGYFGEGPHRFGENSGLCHSHNPEDPHASRKFTGSQGSGASPFEGAVHADVQLLQEPYPLLQQ